MVFVTAAQMLDTVGEFLRRRTTRADIIAVESPFRISLDPLRDNGRIGISVAGEDLGEATPAEVAGALRRGTQKLILENQLSAADIARGDVDAAMMDFENTMAGLNIPVQQ